MIALAHRATFRLDPWLPIVLCLLTGIAGWHYLFYSTGAQRLRNVESAETNARRVRLRKANGLAMILLAVVLYIGMRVVDSRANPGLFALVWLAVVLLVLVVLVLGLIDLRLTTRLRVGKDDRDLHS